MTEKMRNDLFYVCPLIEYVARQTKNRRGVVIAALGREGIEKQLYDAEAIRYRTFSRMFIIRTPIIWSALTERGIYWIKCRRGLPKKVRENTL